MKKIRCEICNKDFGNEKALGMHNSSKHHDRKSNKKIVLISAAALTMIILSSVLFFASKDTSSSTDEIQRITLSFGQNYEPNTIEVKSGMPVEITLDSSVQGCFRAFVIPELGVSKISKSPSDKVKFTPQNPGIYRFQCGMNMGYGTIIVT